MRSPNNNKLPPSQAPCEPHHHHQEDTNDDGRSCRNINLESTFGGSNNNSCRSGRNSDGSSWSSAASASFLLVPSAQAVVRISQVVYSGCVGGQAGE